eukprot:CAMPEP_0175390266 /NCGR_PEP_ID=MMETSP0095-20121207/31317_1 /TAXON_ID=311494 /ORGANISM="Alexandrium monilatum, Strain CCMP3105" /LENGTH=293 /DNA_ID=CAMNT_0016688805 /DNA_START=11 /DNA_END=890 /DNA_ORIENTATION=-
MAAVAPAAWIGNFLDEVEAGHAGRTMEVVTAIRKSSNSRVQLADLRTALDGERSAVARNRLLRRWLTSNRELMVVSWASLGLPVPAGGDGPSAAAACQPNAGESVPNASRGAPRPAAPRRTAGSGYAGVAVFDFDQTLSIRHLGVFEDLGQAQDRTFGGAARVTLLKDMLRQVTSSGVAVAVVTRNSKHVVSRALQAVGLLQFVVPGLILGFEDYGDEIPKSSVILDRVLPALRLPSSAVLFADDDPANIKDVSARCPDASCLHCQRTGLAEGDCANIVAWADPQRDALDDVE